ncbi:hypothetical protein HDV01_005610 [Terramyces sp. JEL0728]|nr:hypothetical protein HDV01_005610 [Terramyces sp. JEL0728]
MGSLVANQNPNCISKLVDIQLNSTCPDRYYCQSSDNPIICVATPECSLNRTNGILCKPQGIGEPIPCPAGYFCTTPNEQDICPSDHYCPTGTVNPIPCSLGSVCFAGSAYEQNYLGVIAFITIDVILFIVFIAIYMMNQIKVAEKQILEHPHIPEPKILQVKKTISKKQAKPTPKKENGFQDKIILDAFTRCRNGTQTNIRLKFEELSLTLPSGVTILNGVSGEISPGKFTAIMGPSGAGKTTFLNVLSGKVNRTAGQLYINDTEGSLGMFKNIIGFVPQEDTMLREMTVRENIYHSARIRAPTSWTDQEVSTYVDALLKALQLDRVADSLIGDEYTRGVSGGQRKRVNIGMELGALPLAVFLDEPTSGLDSTSSLNVAVLLKNMAELGLSTIAVIHQPRLEIYNEIDDILLLIPGGRTAYLGPRENAQEYFENLGYKFDPSKNPCDILMDIVSNQLKPRAGYTSLTPDEIADEWNYYTEHGCSSKQIQSLKDLASDPEIQALNRNPDASPIVFKDGDFKISKLAKLSKITEGDNDELESSVNLTFGNRYTSPSVVSAGTGTVVSNLYAQGDLFKRTKAATPTSNYTGANPGTPTYDYSSFGLSSNYKYAAPSSDYSNINPSSDYSSVSNYMPNNYAPYVAKIKPLYSLEYNGIKYQPAMPVLHESVKKAITKRSKPAQEQQRFSQQELISLCNLRGSSFIKQFGLCLKRSFVQQYRHYIDLVFEILVSVIVGYFLGMSNQKYAGELYRGVLIQPLALLSSTPREGYVVGTSFNVALAICIAAGPAGVNIFGPESIVYYREAASGHNRFAYYLAKTVGSFPRIMLSSLHMIGIFYFYIAPATSFICMYLMIMLTYFGIYGLATIVSVTSKRESQAILSTLAGFIPAFFSGRDPRIPGANVLVQFLLSISYNRWGTELFYSGELSPKRDIYQVDQVSQPIFGYTLGREGFDLAVMLAIGVVLRIIGFIAIRLYNQEKQR